MNKILKNIDLVNNILKRHERYTNFSGTACIVTGVLWLINEGLNIYFNFSTITRIISWIVVVIFAVIIAVSFTFSEREKGGKEKVTLSLMALVDKLIIISIGTLILMWVFYSNNMTFQIPALLLLMYGILILTSKRNIANVIQYFGYVNLTGGVFAFLMPQYSFYTTWIVLGLGHIILGVVLLLHREK